MLHSGTGGGSPQPRVFRFRTASRHGRRLTYSQSKRRHLALGAGSNVTLLYRDSLRTGLPVDDLLIITSAEGGVYLQAKRSIKLSPGEDSDLASAGVLCASLSGTAASEAWSSSLGAAT